MRTWKIFLLLAVLIGFGTAITCHIRETRRIKWNDRLVRIASDALKESAQFRHDFLSEFEKNKTDYEVLAQFCSQADERITTLADNLKAMKPIKGGEEMLSLSVELLELLSLCVSRSRELAAIPAVLPFDDEKFTALAAEVDDLWSQIGSKHREIVHAQARMAERFDYTLEKKGN
jgi:hypothetical protein